MSLHALLLFALLQQMPKPPPPEPGPAEPPPGTPAMNVPVPAAPPAAAAPTPTTLRVRAVGDVMLGTTVPEGNMPPDDGAQMLAGVKDLLQDADLTFANLEGPLCDGGETKKCKRSKNCYAFRTPTRFGAYLKDAGIDVVSTANNHSGDFGEPCRRETEATLDALGIAWSGPPGSVATLNVKGKRIALIAFHTSKATNDVNDSVTATKLVSKAKASHDIVIVSFHGGAEGLHATRVKIGREMFHGENRGNLRAFTHAVVEAGADLVLGHGPHVARAMEVYRGRLIAYSMGNFATYGRFDLRQALGRGMVLEVELTDEGRFLRGKIIPTRQLGRGVPAVDPTGGVIEDVRDLTGKDFGVTAVVIDKTGVVLPP